MRIAINGTGVAGPALAWWLRRYGHEPILFEKAPQLRTGGYVIDFWGVGYDVAEKMGLAPELRQRGYFIKSLRMVDARGKVFANLNVDVLRPLVQDRFFSIPRGEIAAAIYRACGGVASHFGESIAGIEEHAGGVRVTTTLGSALDVDLVVGADGLHSAVRSITFGPEQSFERFLGYRVAAFSVPGYHPRDELAYVSQTIPNRQVSRVALRNDATLFLFIWRAGIAGDDAAATDPKAVLRSVFGDMQWEVPRILAQLDRADEIYFDGVSQIRMDRWSRGRVALVGDAAACVSFLAGEGTGLAMAEAYILAGEIHRAGADYAAAFRAYESKLRPLLASKQKAALKFAGFFAPKSALGLLVRNSGIRISAWPPLARWFMARFLRDDLVLPDYG